MARDELIRRATRQEEARALGGDDDGPGPYDVLEAALTAALERVRELRAHAHRWEVDEDTNRCLCSICGADGDA